MRILILFLLLSEPLLAGKPEWIPDYFVHYEKDKNPSNTGSRIKIICEFDTDYSLSRKLRVGINGSDETIPLNEKNEAVIIRKSQKAIFQFFYDSNFQEIETDSISIKKGEITIISLRFKIMSEKRTVKKPVIYLYPETDLALSIDLKPAGNLTFSYPQYSNEWKGVAHPDGSITIDEKTYPYLFWESEQQFNFFDRNIGCLLLYKENLIETLDKHLTELGFNDKEKTDFITFWGPQLAKHKLVLAQFLINESCNQFATLDIHPKPAHVNRVYLIWTTFDLNTSQIPLIKSQILKPLNREGFDVLEWGGIEIPKIPNFD
ncbi:hypothetical protein [Fluviicola taffensis]|uniref:Uncharacterized protein n=1 Tax=Fluviicola taffensis (strain DSM 16823 / NCIMB 13979 / RW262) TaxID=755732 RepID=F2ICL0_FLUTR|nr:hypothetical protein [Fluviicola taffensis]AEA42237.1 hypothetical protein Fluta_0228 [Fluviicola taffensis DSM 16823]